MNINKKLFISKPTNNRLQKEIETYNLLDKLNITYTGVDHEAAMTIEDLYEVEKTLNVKVAKNLLLCNSSKTDFHLLIMPGHKKFVTKDFSKQIGSSRLSFASGEHMEKLLNITPAALSVLGLMFDRERKVHLAIDKEVLELEFMGCHPCVNTSTIKVKTTDIKDRFIAYTGHEVAIVEL